ncbi:potassium-transporting ATPase subunit KdpA [Brachybacterium halotolerans subsp. kimchii]|uniref:potassium-transporting ATPase subunit KdpA n=1 Tax=Micrococcales TaxID=85006 RepID=UPI0007A4EE11|nr:MULTISPECIES: potassium-transporting ATPase subunit KdpA [Micrococcales]MCZ4327421.1 potassium-transporting ATPase subunit KdpA [Brachybacterium paraconglomeratum]MDH5151785.1 potassium-transporting ATPase subunit KdpA [Kocuria palustris]UEJ82785.1 potassium-transporting ATPase subunit KdpA [Brachybacterium halotolerans subsp. kimchii]
MDWLYLVASVLTLVAALAVVYRPMGDYMAWVFTAPVSSRWETRVFAVLGVDSSREQSWPAYLRSVLLFSLVGVLALFGLLRLQELLPYSLGNESIDSGVAFNTAISFVTNTNWQAYSGEDLSYTVQFAGLAVQNFVSAATGIAVAVALVRGLARRRTGTIGNFWVDLLRGTFLVLLPVSILSAVVLIAGGVVQNFQGYVDVTTVAGGTQTLPGGPVASQEAIKEIGTNGGGFYNANASHPFENPTGWTSLFQVFLILLIPFSLPRTFGTMVGDHRQGYAIAATMGTLYLASVSVLAAFEFAGQGTAPELAGAAMEGKETRFGLPQSVLYAATTTLTSTGSVNSMHDSYTALGGMVPMVNMLLGEIAPGGVGAGLYGMLVIAIIAVFVAGLLVGRTPEYLGKKIGPREMKLASLYILVMPLLVLGGVALSFAVPPLRHSIENVSLTNTGSHGLSEVLYAFASGANNNGSAFAGLTASTPWLTTAIGVAMLLGRFLPIALVLALAGSFAAQDRIPATSGTLPTHRPLFVGLTVGTALLVTALVFFPVLTLGPLAEGLQ